ncbi:MAG: hypothetical protein ACI80S_002144, partial [Pseudohongiellaceae bacterium]
SKHIHQWGLTIRVSDESYYDDPLHTYELESFLLAKT